MRPTKTLLCCASALASLGFAGAAHAQQQSESSTLIETAIPDDFDRGRNVSVLETPRPDYEPIGIQVANFKVTPSLSTSIGATNNVYDLSGSRQVADGFVNVAPQVIARSDWSRHELDVSAGAGFQRYFSETPRDQTSFDLRALGRLDMGDNIAVTTEAQFARQYETVDTGAIQANLSLLSSYQRSFLSVRGSYGAGQARFVIALDRTAFTFNRIEDPTAGTIDQAYRDRVVYRGTGQAQYAFTPSVAIYGQASLSDTSYSEDIPGSNSNRDSTSGRFIAGMTMDLGKLLRGKIGIGYAFRDYRSAVFKNVSAFSAEAKIEYFFSPLTTFTFQAGRTIEDASIGNTSAYFDNRLALRADHELLRNLLLNAGAEYIRQEYVDSTLVSDTYRISGGATYLSSRVLRLFGNMAYIRHTDNGTALNSRFGEWVGRVGVILTR